MKILMIAPREIPYNSLTVRELPCGGTEKTFIFLGEAFQKLGHVVTWATSTQELGDILEQVYLKETDYDTVITQEAQLLERFFEFKSKAKRVWWTHHFIDQPIIQRNAAYARCFADKVVTLSDCQQQEFKKELRIDSVKIGHGVWQNEIRRGVEKDPNRLIYASTPFRGLEKIPELFKAIKSKNSLATIAICSSMGTYGQPDKDLEYKRIFDELKTIDGVELLGALNQEQLYEQYARASIFFYPCTWRETYCLALDEATAHGCSPITSTIGALGERVALKRFRIGDPRQNYHNQSLSDLALRRMGGSPDIMEGLMPKDWLEIAQQWCDEVMT